MTTVRPTLAALFFALMFLVSASVAIYSGWLLFRGEVGEEVFTALPGACTWVVLVDEPDAVAGALQVAATLPQLAPEVQAFAKTNAASWARLAAVPGLDATAPWAVCGRGPGFPSIDGAVAAVMATGIGAEAGPRLAAALGLEHAAAAGSSAWIRDGERLLLRDATGRVAMAARQDGKVLRLSWAAAPADAGALLDAAVAQARTEPLQKAAGFREAVERVGGGQVHVWLAKPTAGAAAKALGAPAGLDEGLQHLTWAAAVLRHERGMLKLHAHLGTDDQRGAVWLKQQLDVSGAFDAGTVLDSDAQAFGTVRLPPQRWRDLAMVAPQAAAVAEALAAVGATTAGLTGHVAWQATVGTDMENWRVVAALQPAATVRLPEGAAQASPALAVTAGKLVAASDPAELQRGLELLAGKGQTLREADPPAGLGRLLDTTQGVVLRGKASAWGRIPGVAQGPVQAEWLWLETGLVAELAFPVP